MCYHNQMLVTLMLAHQLASDAVAWALSRALLLMTFHKRWRILCLRPITLVAIWQPAALLSAAKQVCVPAADHK